jgi:hypothetical protein
MAKKTIKELQEENEQLRKQLRENEELLRRAAIKAIKLMAKIKQSEAPQFWIATDMTPNDRHLGWQQTPQAESAQVRK